MKPYPFWIKERRNPQLGTYWVPEGRMSITQARKKEETLYGENFMHRFDTEKKYLARIAELKRAGERIS